MNENHSHPYIGGPDNTLWDPWLVSSLTKITFSTLAQQNSGEPPVRPKLRWRTHYTEIIDVELILTGPNEITLWINPEVYRSEADALALRGLAAEHDLKYVLAAEHDLKYVLGEDDG